MTPGLIIVGFLVLCAFVIVLKSALVVQQSECVVIERLGRYSRTLPSGFNVILPFLDQARPMFWVTNGEVRIHTTIDLRETVLDIAEQAVITNDNVSIVIDALLYIQITDPVKALYEISNLPFAIAQLTQTSLRNVIGEMDLDKTLSGRDMINSRLKAILDDASDKWGAKVNRVEIKNITPPREIQLAMEKQMQAERERRAQILSAEGDKTSRITRSEGEKEEQINLANASKQSSILKAEGESEAIRMVAIAKGNAIEEIKRVLNDSELAAKFLITQAYIDAFEGFVTKPSDKVFIPYETSTAFASLGSVKELLMSDKKKS
ncbi:MAG: SPFH/Band 7/PHB domain protein [Proteobacteria bacterium]|nr:MAG: SPFH/Band 7/PHB domain protein [Pseudomonadota bacterium]